MKTYKNNSINRMALESALALILMVGTAMSAFAQDEVTQVGGCQASGSIPIFPSAGTSCPPGLAVGQEKNIAITITNTSSTVGGIPTPVAATLKGTITFTLACTDTTCSTLLPGTLVFVPQ